ncbi:MAG: thymidine phosphorylase [Xanthomonadales bacterium]|nr:thymidine phosphorylase [Gammaproteobacteria bacterium]MBT8050556.1 thymidine phosphorylase [Gammaproteobacteria bacterium]MBT8055843.1 thymidine phosphorylase [Gammaproteobacteria bacterium]NNJ80085.1 thymidine phosphorylase [Xanthomonadales bacterium]NNL04514.1 thymidine phosphorylase [Xanthomonadales bacterium]
MIRAETVIQRKRDGRELDAPAIAAFVEGVTSGEVSDAQIAAFTMATWFRGMTPGETALLTLAMRDSGQALKWPELDGPVLDKHSTGGVGDMVSLLLGPIVAACGGFVPMISGRGLGHTGGTLDKLESIPGFDTAPGRDRFVELVAGSGIAIVGQSNDLAPADRRIYAVRDVTATVSSPPLMISSILSKKLSEGLDGLVLDIKCGNGAFTTGREEARALAFEMASVSQNAGLPCHALVTDMDAPLAWSAGNALEVREIIDYLTGTSRNPRLDQVTGRLTAELLCIGGLAESPREADQRVRECLSSGAAAESFARMVVGQGGPADLLENPDAYLPRAPFSRHLFVERKGYVTSVDTQAVGHVVVSLGGGRRRAEDDIDPAVGLAELAMPGDRLERGDVLARIEARDEASWQEAAESLKRAYCLGESRPDQDGNLIHDVITGERT